MIDDSTTALMKITEDGGERRGRRTKETKVNGAHAACDNGFLVFYLGN